MPGLLVSFRRYLAAKAQARTIRVHSTFRFQERPSHTHCPSCSAVWLISVSFAHFPLHSTPCPASLPSVPQISSHHHRTVKPSSCHGIAAGVTLPRRVLDMYDRRRTMVCPKHIDTSKTISPADLAQTDRPSFTEPFHSASSSLLTTY